MAVLSFFDFLGMLSSFVAHLCLLSGVSLPSGKIALALNIGIGITLGARLFSTRELRRGKGWYFHKSLKNICPYRVKVAIGLIITYGIISCVFSVSKMASMLSATMTEEDSIIASRNLFIGVFSLIMVCYAIEFLLVYVYKTLKKAEMQKLENEGFSW